MFAWREATMNPTPTPGSSPTPTPTADADAAKLDFSKDMSYGDYLHLDAVLGAQHPLSPEHNEMLFIVQHQTSELWMKLLLHELAAAVQCIQGDKLGSAFKMLARVSKIMEQLVHAWDVLATMTPPEYSAIRPYLASSSGFQSWHARQQECGDVETALAPTGLAGASRSSLARAVALRRVAAPARAARLERTAQPHRARLDPAL
jgi:tryptophan 2,3-dioxygenase